MKTKLQSIEIVITPVSFCHGFSQFNMLMSIQFHADIKPAFKCKRWQEQSVMGLVVQIVTWETSYFWFWSVGLFCWAGWRLGDGGGSFHSSVLLQLLLSLCFSAEQARVIVHCIISIKLLMITQGFLCYFPSWSLRGKRGLACESRLC